MNKLTKELQEILVPQVVLVAYTCESRPYGNRQKFHLELRLVDGDGKMGAAVPVSHEFMNTLVENYSVETNGIPYGSSRLRCSGATPAGGMRNTSGTIRREDGACISRRACTSRTGNSTCRESSMWWKRIG